MDNLKRYAITAIGDAQDEGFIAASLERQGWKVIYRALSPGELLRHLETLDATAVTLFTSSDFVSDGLSFSNGDRPHISEIRLAEIPRSDHDFSEIIRGSTEQVSQSWTTLPPTPIVTFTSFGRSVGTSTIALNVASEITEQGCKVLLIDAHSRNPFLSSYLQIFGVKREVVQSQFGFSIFEASDAEGFAKIEEVVGAYQLILLDIGEVWQPTNAIIGNRSEDYAFRWAAHFSSEIVSISTAQGRPFKEINSSLSELKKLAIKPNISHLINNAEQYSPKERTIRQEQIEQEIHYLPTLLPRDDRAVTRAKAASLTLTLSAPKSALRGEILRYCRDRDWTKH